MTAGAARVTAIVALTPERLIGRDNDLPWHFPEDLRHFKRTTKGHTVVVGRKSWDSTNGALPKRLNVVISRSVEGPATEVGGDGLERDGGTWFSSLDAAFDWIARCPDDAAPTGEVFVLGGAQIFRLVLEPLDVGRDGDGAAEPLPTFVPDRLVVTWLPSQELTGHDVLFPVDEAWIEKHYEADERWDGETPGLRFVSYVRRT